MPDSYGGLGSRSIIAFSATRNPDRAMAFYRDTLGLKFVSADRFAVVFDSNGTMLRVAVVPELTPAPYTILGWDVPDIDAEVDALRLRGVEFERYPGIPQDERGIWRAPGGASVAWFRDPDGNTLSLTQY